MALFIPTYFAPISQYSEIIKSDKIFLRCMIIFKNKAIETVVTSTIPNKILALSIPIKHQIKEGRKETKDTLVENDFPWQNHHFKSLKIAYRTSPFFDLFEDDIAPIFQKKYKYLQDVNIDTFLFIEDALQLDARFSKTEKYEVETTENDFRLFAEKKHQPKKMVERYIQMFDDEHGFIPNLSILDLLFMEGPNTISYL